MEHGILHKINKYNFKKLCDLSGGRIKNQYEYDDENEIKLSIQKLFRKNIIILVNGVLEVNLKLILVKWNEPHPY